MPVTNMRQKDDTRQTKKLLEAIELFRGIDPSMPLQQIVFFLGAISGEEDITLTELCKRLDIAQSSASRVMATLAGYDGALAKPLLRVIENPHNRRAKLIQLTPDGRQLVNKLSAIIGR